jgi:hypothetical protein
MAEFTGFVKKITVKQGQGKRGPWSAYSVKIEKENGNEYEEWLSSGFEAPNFKEGEYVTIEAAQNDKGYWQIKSSKVLKNAPAKKSSAAGAGASVGGANSRESTIHYQSSRKDAIEVLRLLTDVDALPISGAKTAAGVAKRYEEVMALVDKLTVRFYNDVETKRILETVIDEGAADGETEADDEEIDPTPEADD